jgi:hypothetical protein
MRKDWWLTFARATIIQYDFWLDVHAWLPNVKAAVKSQYCRASESQGQRETCIPKAA